MRKVNEVIVYVSNLAKNIKTTGSATSLDTQILRYVQEDKVPYAGMSNKGKKILENLEKIREHFGDNMASEFRGYLEEHPVITEYGGPGSHVNISQAAVNNSFVFMLGLVVTALLPSEQ